MSPTERHIGLWGAVAVGVGAIVGGGILVLAGVAFERAGPSAVIAFALNGGVAFITALSVAEIATSFPQSGGAYMFAKKVLSVRAAFVVGWVLWFAYIVAAVLYALGFASYAALALRSITELVSGEAPQWLATRGIQLTLAAGATLAYCLALARRASGGSSFATFGKVVVFAVLILVGIGFFIIKPQPAIRALSPFFAGGGLGLLSAMGFTFIALQGFEIIAAVAGEIKDPQRNIPRAMFISLGAALAIYLPLLLVVASVGVGGDIGITQLSERDPDTVIAVAVRNYMGGIGYWLVVVAAILSTLSALQANVLAASRVALAMATDRTLPPFLAQPHAERRTPVVAIAATALAITATLAMVPDLSSAGAAASLIFLISFALTHLTAVLARKRRRADFSAGDEDRAFLMPWYPFLPIAGGIACVVLALYQSLVVPSAGAIIVIWMGLGSLLYLSIFSHRAEVSDAWAEATDPSLVRLRGRSPLVLLPVANPAHASSMIEVANALAPRAAGKVLLLSIVTVEEDADTDTIAPRLRDAQAVVGKALQDSYGFGHSPEALITAAPEPWSEIKRVATLHNCASILIGLGHLTQQSAERAQRLMEEVDCDVAIMRAIPGWRAGNARRILVPVGGRGDQNEQRARLLGSLCRTAHREITFLRAVAGDANSSTERDAVREVRRLADFRATGEIRVSVERSANPAEAVIAAAQNADLIVMGMGSASLGSRRTIGNFPLRVVEAASCPTILVSRRPYRPHEVLQPLLRS